MRRTKPASTKPMNAMNRPMPTPIAVLSASGMASNTAVRKPVSTRTRDQEALEHDQAHGVGPGHLRLASWNATNALSPSPAAIANG